MSLISHAKRTGWGYVGNDKLDPYVNGFKPLCSSGHELGTGMADDTGYSDKV